MVKTKSQHSSPKVIDHFLRYERIKSIIISSLGRLHVEDSVLRRACDCGAKDCNLYYDYILPGNWHDSIPKAGGVVIGNHWYSKQFLSRREIFIFLTRGI